MQSTCNDAAAPAGAGSTSGGGGAAEVGEERRQGFGVQEWPDGSKYEGEFVDGFKHGKGRYSGRNGEYYEGFFYKDYKHGDGVYCWPTGHKFTGKFYLNRKEGYGHLIFPGGAIFQGLYHSDQRFGPGVFTYPDGRQDVGLWLGQQLLKICSSVEEGFSLHSFPEYAAFMQPANDALFIQPQRLSSGLSSKTPAGGQVDIDGDPLSDESFVLPPGIERYSTDGDHLPLPAARRAELERLFHGELWEPDARPHRGYEREPLSILPVQPRMQAHVHKHRLQAENIGWDVAAVLSQSRAGFGPKGPLEVASERLIEHSSRGEVRAVSRILQTAAVCPDVADAEGQTALIAATVSLSPPCESGPQVGQADFTWRTAVRSAEPRSTDTSLTAQSEFSQLSARPSEEKSEETAADSDEEEREETGEGEGFEDTEKAGDTENESRSVNDEIKTDLTEREETGADEPSGVECSVRGETGSVQRQGNPAQEGTSDCSVHSCGLAAAGETPSPTGRPQQRDSHVLRVRARHRARLHTLKLLLERGADPNLARVPMPVLFLAIMAGDTEVVRNLLLCGARTDIPLPTERKGFYPLHVAAALPGPNGAQITELLLHAITDPDARACDRDDIYQPDLILLKDKERLDTRKSPGLNEGGRTALHIACQRENDYSNACKVVALLLSHRASTDLLWSGHSPLSLAIASGNDLAVEELLKGGADPNLPLGCRVGSALCALANVNYHLGGNRVKLLDKLAKAGADVLMPVTVGDAAGTAVDFAHHLFHQDLHIARTPFHTLSAAERETFRARRHLLREMSALLRRTAGQVERRNAERERRLPLNASEDESSNGPAGGADGKPEPAKPHRQPAFRFCYHCGRSAFVKLIACGRCLKVFFCSKTCKLEAWDERHKDECLQVSASADVIPRNIVFKTQRGGRPLTAMTSKPEPQPLTVAVRSLKVPEPFAMAEKVLDCQVSLKENYSTN